MAVIVLFAAALRCDQITERSIWFDEAFSWTLASQFGLSEVITRTAQDVHPPLYYLILSAWVSVFGQSLLAMRLLSVLLGTAAVLAAFLVGKAAIRAFECIAKQGRDPSTIAPTEDGTWLGMSFAILLAVSPFQIHWSGEVRMYSLLTLLFLLSVLFGLQALSGSRSRRLHWAGFSLTSAAMVYTHNVGLFSFVAESLFFFSASLYLSRRTCDAAVPGVVRDCVIAIGVVGLIYLPWVPALLHQRSQVAANYWISRFSLQQLAIAWDGVLFPENTYSPWRVERGGTALVVMVLLLAGLQIRGQFVDRLCLILTVVPILLAILISMASTSIIAHRLFVLAHVSALLSLARVVRKWLEPRVGLLMTLLFAADCLWLQSVYCTQLDLSVRTGPRGAAEWVEANADPDEPILVLQPCIYFSLRYHAGNPDRITLCTTEQNILHFTGAPILKTAERLDFSAIGTLNSTRIWVIDTTGFSAGYSLPLMSLPWEWKQEKRFPAPFAFEGEVIVSEYVRAKVTQGGYSK